MGMTIEDVKEELISILTEIEITGGSMVTSKYKEELKVAIEIMRKYQQLQANYENRLKADMVAMLDKIRAEIEKLQKMCDKNDLNLMAQYSAFGMVLDILDKYKAESEEV